MEDHAVDALQLRLERDARAAPARLDRALDLAAGPTNAARCSGTTSRPERAARQRGVERAPVRESTSTGAPRRQPERPRRPLRRDVRERRTTRRARPPTRPRLAPSGRHVDDSRATRRLGPRDAPPSSAHVTSAIVPCPHAVEKPSLWKKTTPSDDPSATGGVTKQPYMSACPRGSCTSSRRTSSSSASREAAALEDRRALQLRDAACHDAERLAGRVEVDRADRGPGAGHDGHSGAIGDTCVRCYGQVMGALMFIGSPFDPQAAGRDAAKRPDDDEALDAYSRVVSGVAEQLTPSVANLRVSAQRPRQRP